LGNTVTVTADVTNSGTKAGDEVAQLYINTPSTLVRPIKQLKGFSRISLQPGETKTVSFKLKYEDLQYYDVVSRSFKVEAGTVNLLVGSSSQDIRLNTTIGATAGTVSETYRQNPYTQVEAEDYENKTASVMLKSCSEGGLCLDSLLNNSNVVYKNFNFNKGALQFKARQASSISNGSISIVLDSLSGPVAGTLTLTNTGSISTFATDSCSLNEIKGIHDVYLVLKGGSATAGTRLNWFTFKQSAASPNALSNTRDNSVYKLNIYPNPASSSFNIDYNLPVSSDVQLEIATMQGVVVKTMAQTAQSAGAHHLKVDTATEQLASGIYIVRFVSRNYNKSLLLNLIK